MLNLTIEKGWFFSSKYFKAIVLSPRQNDHKLPCLCYARDLKKVAVIGGHDKAYKKASKTVEVYDLQSDRWSVLPEL